MAQITPNSRIALTLGSVLTVAGALLYAGWAGANALRDVKDELNALRSDVRGAWSGRDMKDYNSDLGTANTGIQRTDGKLGLIVPDVRRIQRANRENP